MSELAAAENLYVVPGHAVPMCTEATQCGDRRHWAGRYDAYQGNEEPELYMGHIRAAVRAAGQDPFGLLTFSGGQTRAAAGRRSEAQAYAEVAELCGWFGFPDVRGRVRVEEYARDSYENVANSILLFLETVGRCPLNVNFYGFGFKSSRFLFHADTLKSSSCFPCREFRFLYVSVNDPPKYILCSGSLAGEAQAFNEFMDNPRGDRGALLRKRLARDPFRRGNPYLERFVV
jgi:hypothetical protein